MGKEGKADHRRHKHSPWKRRNAGMPVGYSGQMILRRRAMLHVDLLLGNDYEVSNSTIDMNATIAL
jgi:hypothetical protein